MKENYSLLSVSCEFYSNVNFFENEIYSHYKFHLYLLYFNHLFIFFKVCFYYFEFIINIFSSVLYVMITAAIVNTYCNIEYHNIILTSHISHRTFVCKTQKGMLNLFNIMPAQITKPRLHSGLLLYQILEGR